MFRNLMRFLTTCHVFLFWVLAASESDVCGPAEVDQPQSQALLQIGASSFKSQSVQPATTGNTAPLTDTGYESVAQLCCAEEMMAFIKRVIETSKPGFEVCHVGGLPGFTLWYDCTDDMQSFATMKEQLREAVTRDCPWLARPGNCTPLPPNCPGFPGATLPPCIAVTTATTTPGPCLGKPKDIFMAIDASKSVTAEGWTLQAKFARDLVEALVGKGNPTQHRINAHWFNGVTFPLTGGTGVFAEGGKKNQEDLRDANDVGKWVSAASDVDSLKTEISEIDYTKTRFGATDHPQVYLTASKAFITNPNPKAHKMLILITDGETHAGNECGKLPDKPLVYSVVGDCDNEVDHPCRRTDPDKSCNFAKCICGLYKAEMFKKNYELVVVGVANGMHNTTFEAQMERMASNDRLYFANSFTDLQAITSDIQGDICSV